MNRDTIVYCTCTLVLGVIIGWSVGSNRAKPAVVAAPSDPMTAVRQQLATLKEQVARDPHNADALVQLGNMYMDAAKNDEAATYYERALAVRDDTNVRIDLGICYKNAGHPEKALAAFRRAAEQSPGQWQPLYNEAIVLGEMRRFDEARAVAAKLKRLRPEDRDVQRLDQALSAAK